MTLKITRFLTDIMNKQAKISHFANKIIVGKPKNIKISFKEKIKDQFGELFLNDANYIIITNVNTAKVNDLDKFIKKFVDLVSHVLNTEIDKYEVKQLKNEKDEVAIDNVNEEDEIEDEVENINSASENIILLIKVTTK